MDLSRCQPATDRLLLIHPSESLRSSLRERVERLGLEVQEAQSIPHAIEVLRNRTPFGVIMLGGGNARFGDHAAAEILSGLRRLVKRAGLAQIIILNQWSLDIETCSEIVRMGVSGILDLTTGTIEQGLLAQRIEQAQQRHQKMVAEAGKLHAISPENNNSLVWRSSAMAAVLAKATRAAQVSDVPVLIHGESGTGKQLLAELVHRMDPKRSSKRFLSINCAAITGTLAESTLFGHVKGAFTGATGSRKGHFRAADGGTILLDEIGEMDTALQPKLLRVLQEGVVMPLGSDDEIPIDVRVIASTNRRLPALVEQGKFRLDLYQRLNVVELEIPPLRERVEDVPALIQFFLKKYGDYYEKPIDSVDSRVIEFLTNCTLQGNVRELENSIRQMLAFKNSGTQLVLADIPPSILGRANKQQRSFNPAEADLADAAWRLVDSNSMTLPELVSACEKTVLENSIERLDTTSTDLAKRLGLSRRTLYNKIHKYDLPAPRRGTTPSAD